MGNLQYRLLLQKEPEGGYTVTVPTLARARVTFGETVDGAIAMAREAIELYIEDLQEKGEEIPTEEGLLEYTLTVEAHASTSGTYGPENDSHSRFFFSVIARVPSRTMVEQRVR
ncbi:MAG: hypothetical protein CVV31_04170 [Methanomicrobiales archaeon HGW-Methanomicrobiales-2]|nr:MAG: hypothetical protein CVV31_04170 [Methanomicrobiales archaeon HGW-Methanomicrobiales-2]